MEKPYIDIHTHRTESVEGVLMLGSQLWGGEKPVNLPYYSKGVHPWDADKICRQELSDFFADCTNITAIGECGLDFTKKTTDRTTQIQVFEYQVIIAVEKGLPIVIHCVKAFNEVIEILVRHSAKKVIFHSFSGSKETAARLVKLGYYISFSPRLLDSAKQQNTLTTVGLNNIFVETDDMQNADIKRQYQYISNFFNVNLTALKEHIYNNYERVAGAH